MRLLHTLVLLASLSLATPAPATASTTSPAPTSSERVRGVFISTHTSGREWGEDEMASTLDDIRAVGADWVAIHPYARIDKDGSVRYRDVAVLDTDVAKAFRDSKTVNEALRMVANGAPS